MSKQVIITDDEGNAEIIRRPRKSDVLVETSVFHPNRAWVVQEVILDDDGEAEAYQLKTREWWHREWYDASELHHLLSTGLFGFAEKNNSLFTIDSNSTTNTSHSIGFDPGGGTTGSAAVTANDVTLNVGQQSIDVQDVSITPDTSQKLKKMKYSDRI